MRIKARAKINWTLDIVGKRADGYHLLDSLIQSVELYDTLTIRPAETLEFALEGYARVPDDDTNLALRAARLLMETAQVKTGASLLLKKRIPVGAGMGGGSADAAAVLMGLNRFWRLNLPEEQLRGLGLAIGADVPFCMSGGFQRITGIGENLARLSCMRPAFLVIVQPCRGLSTRDVFGQVALDRIGPHQRPDNVRAVQAIADGRLLEAVPNLGNVLQAVAIRQRPEIGEAIQALEHFGALGAQMTGSGSAVFGVFETARDAQCAWESASRIWRRCWTTRTASRGLVFRQ